MYRDTYFTLPLYIFKTGIWERISGTIWTYR